MLVLYLRVLWQFYILIVLDCLKWAFHCFLFISFTSFSRQEQQASSRENIVPKPKVRIRLSCLFAGRLTGDKNLCLSEKFLSTKVFQRIGPIVDIGLLIKPLWKLKFRLNNRCLYKMVSTPFNFRPTSSKLCQHVALICIFWCARCQLCSCTISPDRDQNRSKVQPYTFPKIAIFIYLLKLRN